MVPQLQEQSGVEAPLEEALEAAENDNTRYHIRQALQMTKLEE